jgi:hypothetical protein
MSSPRMRFLSIIALLLVSITASQHRLHLAHAATLPADIPVQTLQVWYPPDNQVARDYHGHWTGDLYHGRPLTSMTLAPGERSDQVTIYFRNDGPTTWDSNTVLIAWLSINVAGPWLPTDAFCNPVDASGHQDWQRCSNPGIPAWIGYGRIAPGGTATFTFQIKAPTSISSGQYTLYFRPAQRINGQYYWINQWNGRETYEYFDVIVHGKDGGIDHGGGGGSSCGDVLQSAAAIRAAPFPDRAQRIDSDAHPRSYC